MLLLVIDIDWSKLHHDARVIRNEDMSYDDLVATAISLEVISKVKEATINGISQKFK